MIALDDDEAPVQVTAPERRRAAERVKTLGDQVLNGQMEIPGGDRIAQCMNRQGAAFAVHSLAGCLPGYVRHGGGIVADV
jgi:predicted enzyme related to lactoylglutathione lyase